MHKRAIDSPKRVWCTVGKGSAWWGVCLNNLERGGGEPKLKGWINQKPTCLKENPERDLVPVRSCAKPWATIYIMSARNQKLLNSKELDPILSLLLFHFEDRWNTEKPFTQESFSKNNLWVERKTPSLTLGKVTTKITGSGLSLACLCNLPKPRNSSEQ